MSTGRESAVEKRAENKTAIWTVTRRAALQGKFLAENLKCDLFILEKFNWDLNGDFIQEIKIIPCGNFSETLRENFWNYDSHIFIMATGIVVRKISELLRGKDQDPAVLVADENLNFIISLLSGHLGGANELAERLGKKFRMVPIITTSSDITGKIALDTLAEKLSCQLGSLEETKKITSLIVDGKKVLLHIPENLSVESMGKKSQEKKIPDAEGIVIASNREEIEITRIYPRNLILGIGCRRGTSKEKVIAAVERAMKKHNLSWRSIKLFATVDLKSDEEGILETVREFGSSLRIISRTEIKEIETLFPGSDFVKKSIGVSTVSEPCALLASSGTGKFIEQKFIGDGVTVSIYEERFGNE